MLPSNHNPKSDRIVIRNIKANFLGLNNINLHKLPTIYLLSLATLSIIIAGMVSMYSAGGSTFFYRQLNNLYLGIAASIIMFILSPRLIYNNIYLLYLLNLGLLILASIAGTKVMGATRWLNVFGFKFQPSESTKTILILTLAYILGGNAKIAQWRNFIPPLVIVLVPSLLVINQPDLGTGIILLGCGGIILLMSGLSIRLAIQTIGLALSAAPLIWMNMYDYQKQRIIIFLLNNDKMNSGYNVYQSQIAIGSGGKFGTGFQHGTQSQLGFLPEKHTDFIFASFAEEFGLFAAIGVVLLYLTVICILWYMIFNTTNKTYRLTITGLNSLLFMHFFINIAMVMDILPVVGIPLPLFSYGGTTMISIMGLIGLSMRLYAEDA